MMQSHVHDAPFSPAAITSKLHCEYPRYMPIEFPLNNPPVIAKHLRRGRQEDSHEFLRYAIDALQKSCLAEYSQCDMNVRFPLL
jgi:ubiquitin carboxyl-terminal hydrolase 36/42